MKNIFKTSNGLSLIPILLLSAACSEVAFSPAPDPGSNAPADLVSKPYSESFTQGLVTNKLDILVVVDNSPSMAEEQQKMGEKIDSFLDTLVGVDWQLGVTTTDLSGGKYSTNGNLLQFSNGMFFVNKNTPNYEDLFKQVVVRPESFNCGLDCASGDEEPMRAAIQAMARHNSTNTGFFRTSSDLGLLILSDEDELSVGGAGATQPGQVISTLRSIWGDSKNLYTYGMVIEPDDVLCMASQVNGGEYGHLISSLARMTNGLTGSVCDDDYGPTLGYLAENVKRLLDYVEIKFNPMPDTVRVRFSNSHSTNIRISGRRIYFENPPPKDTRIDIDYIVR